MRSDGERGGEAEEARGEVESECEWDRERELEVEVGGREGRGAGMADGTADGMGGDESWRARDLFCVEGGVRGMGRRERRDGGLGERDAPRGMVPGVQFRARCRQTETENGKRVGKKMGCRG